MWPTSRSSAWAASGARPARSSSRSTPTLFHQVLVNNITGKVGDYKGVLFQMGRSSPRGNDTSVSTIVTRPGNEPARVDWLVSNASGSPKIIDVIAEGTSLRLTQRDDYSAFLSRNNNNRARL